MCIGMSDYGLILETEVVRFKGHTNIKATHRTTLEITKDDHLTPRGDCIIGVSANKALSEFSERFKEIARSPGSRIILLIADEQGNHDVIIGEGHPDLTFNDSTKIIVRKSSYVAPNTVMIRANKAAKDISRDLVSTLRKGGEGIALFIAIKCVSEKY